MSTPSEIRVKDWSQLMAVLTDDKWQPSCGKYRANVVYRGLSNARYDLHTSLFRLRDRASGEVEQHLLRNFRKYAHRDTSPGDWDWNWLSVGQHHGLPTRLLDWTFSPYVALHFATSNVQHFDQDAAVWCVDYVATHNLLPAPLYDEIAALGGGLFTTEMLNKAAKSLDEFDKYRDPHGRGLLVFFEPPSLDDRIVNQSAVFSAISHPTACLSDWLLDHRDLYRKIVIPADQKWIVRNYLDQANVTERVLFPGLDGLSQWLLRYYGNRPTMHPQAPGAPGPN
ncbi:FRG domain-containing protein [Streptomyces aureus]|uniref:FRG domain-containing protein n=1 Tax=Streptomyces aureus TaxID=193461 RepID=UPI00099CA953|nr:FRG domain-containing protein [Streptomyces aureus]